MRDSQGRLWFGSTDGITVVTDEFGNDAIVARKRGFISLGYDHRLVNGADADQFLARVKEILENFSDNSS